MKRFLRIVLRLIWFIPYNVFKLFIWFPIGIVFTSYEYIFEVKGKLYYHSDLLRDEWEIYKRYWRNFLK